MQRPVPDEAIIRRALRLREATETPMERFLREEYDALAGAARVGMDAARKLWPLEIDHLPPIPISGVVGWGEILRHFEKTYELLDRVGDKVFGELLTLAYLGRLEEETLARAEDDAKIGPRHEGDEAPEILKEV